MSLIARFVFTLLMAILVAALAGLFLLLTQSIPGGVLP